VVWREALQGCCPGTTALQQACGGLRRRGGGLDKLLALQASGSCSSGGGLQQLPCWGSLQPAPVWSVVPAQARRNRYLSVLRVGDCLPGPERLLDLGDKPVHSM
jgi:hypothetical protein